MKALEKIGLSALLTLDKVDMEDRRTFLFFPLAEDRKDRSEMVDAFRLCCLCRLVIDGGPAVACETVRALSIMEVLRGTMTGGENILFRGDYEKSLALGDCSETFCSLLGPLRRRHHPP